MTLLSRSATRTHIKPQMTHEPFRRTSALNIMLINSCLTVLVFINAVYSAAMREGSEDLLRFLKDAFEMNLPLDHTEPTQLSVMDLATEKILDPVHLADPTAECEAPEIVVNSAVMEGISSQEMDFMKELDPIIQSFASRMNLKDQAGKPHDTDKHQQESRKRAMDLDSPESVDTSDRPDLDADSEERGDGRGTSQTQISGHTGRQQRMG
ncbi:uncharacterized protein LOC122148010 isoform X2 [Cyprinus carpio]|uniref:Uncharacterized protein LOC122148010 isoform X2 n=1 Tax=Cyprinus carpio TaxID=7962 RepID=A0A9Q9YYD8_CYPCA|nr:uncharacterized protein LOC122148010 isoform X2 [Cyprinus carpio]